MDGHGDPVFRLLLEGTTLLSQLLRALPTPSEMDLATERHLARVLHMQRLMEARL